MLTATHMERQQWLNQGGSNGGGKKKKCPMFGYIFTVESTELADRFDKGVNEREWMMSPKVLGPNDEKDEVIQKGYSG